ncbi:hypothetical protein ACS0TY_035165 [Phlomoides rotata]
MQKLFTIAVGVIYSAKDIFCLRERDLVNRFASEISRYEVQGESKESAFMATFIEAENSVTVASLKGCVWLRTHLTTSTWSSLTLLLLLLAFRNSYHRIKDMYNHISERSRLKAPLIVK